MGLAQLNAVENIIPYAVKLPPKKMRSRRIARTRYRTSDDVQVVGMVHKEILEFLSDARVEFPAALEAIELVKQDIEERYYEGRLSWEDQ